MHEVDALFSKLQLSFLVFNILLHFSFFEYLLKAVHTVIRTFIILMKCRGVGSKLKVGGPIPARSAGKIFFLGPPLFFWAPHFGAKILTVCAIADSGH